MFAKVSKLDKAKGLVKLDVLGRETHWLPCVGGTPSVGQQVAWIEGSNDGTGVVLGSTSMTDGANVTFHMKGIDIDIDGSTIKIKGNGDITGDIEITGDLTLTGDLSVDGNIETTGTVTDTKGDLTNFKTTDGAQRA